MSFSFSFAFGECSNAGFSPRVVLLVWVRHFRSYQSFCSQNTDIIAATSTKPEISLPRKPHPFYLHPKNNHVWIIFLFKTCLCYFRCAAALIKSSELIIPMVAVTGSSRDFKTFECFPHRNLHMTSFFQSASSLL